MLGRQVWLLVFTGLLMASGTAEAQRANRLTLPTDRMLRPYGLERAWWSQATINPNRDRVRHIVADEDVVFLQTEAGLVTAFDAESGKKLWSRMLGRRDVPNFPMSTNDDYAMIVSGMDMYAVEKFTGKMHWKIRLPTAPSATASMDDDLVYIGGRDGSVYAFDLKRIRELYQEQRLPQWTNVAQRWRFKGYKEVSTPPLSTGRVVNFATIGGSLYSVTTGQRKLVFQFETSSSVTAPMTHSRGEYNPASLRRKRFLYMSTEDYKLYCIDMDNGRVRWEYGAGLPIRTPAEVIDKDVFLTPVRGGLHCISEVDGKQQWKRPEGTRFLAATSKLVMASDRAENILLLSRDRGALLGVLPLRSFNVRLANGRTDRLYIATDRGLLVCIRGINSNFPLYHKYPDRRPIEVEFADDAPAAKTPTP